MLEHTMVEGASNLFRLEPGSVAPPFVAALRSGALLARVDAAVLTLAGPGAVTCVQGLLTNDIEQPGDGAFVYGALLTPKGMIVVDGWAGRLGTTVSYTVPAEGRERALGIFTHSVPPRLARVSDRTPDVARTPAGGRGPGAGGDEKPIPQEVRYGESGGLSYTKGCHPGRETGGRLHCRGHTTRQLRGLLFDVEPPAAPADGWSAVTHLDRDVGRVTSVAWVPEPGAAGSGGGRWAGLAVIRGEVTPGAMVRAAGRDARVVALPFVLPAVGPA